MGKPLRIKVRIALFDGEWYAMPGNNNRATRCALVPAIKFCNRLNAARRLAAQQVKRGQS